MSDDLARMADQLEQIAGGLRLQSSQRGWIDQFRAGEVLITSQAADVCEVSPETIRRWCEETDQTRRPLGFLVGSLWLVDLVELLNLIEARRGKHGRLIAIDRAKKYAQMWASPQQSPRNLARATG